MLTKEEVEFIEKYKGRRYPKEEQSSYEQWSLNHFHNKEIILDPYLQITLQLDITEALINYRDSCGKIEGTSFTAFLIWHILQTTKKHQCFCYRKIGDEWYIFDELPMFTPIAIGGDSRFASLLIDAPIPKSLEEFIYCYRTTLNKLIDKKIFEAITPVVWCNSWFIGNLPNIKFTGYKFHMPTTSNGRPYFYFGKRYNENNKQLVPLVVALDHSNTDPLVLSQFMEDFQKSIEGRTKSVNENTDLVL